MTSGLLDMTLGSIVAEDYRAAAVLEHYGLDFCCGGKRTLGDACAARGCAAADVAEAIGSVLRQSDRPAESDAAWDADRLVAHIVSTHHVYVREALPRIASRLAKLIEVHGARHPELARVASHVDVLGRELTTHMYKEEEILFPYIRALSAVASGGEPPANMFGTVRNPIRMMEAEHAGAGQELAILRELIAHMTARDDVWFATHQQVAEYVGRSLVASPFSAIRDVSRA